MGAKRPFRAHSLVTPAVQPERTMCHLLTERCIQRTATSFANGPDKTGTRWRRIAGWGPTRLSRTTEDDLRPFAQLFRRRVRAAVTRARRPDARSRCGPRHAATRLSSGRKCRPEAAPSSYPAKVLVAPPYLNLVRVSACTIPHTRIKMQDSSLNLFLAVRKPGPEDRPAWPTRGESRMGPSTDRSP